MDDYLKQAEKALTYLAESEDDYASLKASHQAEKERIRIIEAQQIMESSESSQTGKQTEARASQAYQDAVEDWRIAIEAFELVNAKRKRAEILIEMFRSVNSALKRGNI